MKTMINFQSIRIGLLALSALLVLGCSKDEPDEVKLIGNDGNPRFNLVFTNPENVDLDLYVKTPSGEVISFYNKEADFGTLDVDCLCSNCPQGPNENIFWENGTAANGTYEYWVDYYDYCGNTNSASDFTLRVIRNGVVLETKTGTLNSGDGESTHWTFIKG